MSKSIKLKNDIFLNGEICDMGTNENGTYIKWANGLMVCYHSLYRENVSSIGSSYGIYYMYTAFTYPKPFISTPVVVGSTKQPSGIFFSSLGNYAGQTNTQTQIRTLRLEPWTNTNVEVSYIAIGKWK